MSISMPHACMPEPSDARRVGPSTARRGEPSKARRGEPSKARRGEPSEARRGERGTALFIALILTVVLTFLGMGLLTRSLLVSRIAGSERWSTKAFYAADAGINAAKARLRIWHTEAFTFSITDFRLSSGASSADDLTTVGTVTVSVSNLSMVGSPQPVAGTQVSGGQGGTVPLYMYFYKGTSTARQEFTNTERVVTSTMTIGPVPPPNEG